MKNVICFIVGEGHSGSTVLDMALGSSPNAFSLGEMAQLTSFSHSLVPCPCGSTVATCRFWQRVRKTIESRCSVQIEANPENFPVRPASMRLRSLANDMLRLGTTSSWIENTRLTLEVIREQSGAALLMDSSKFITRGIALGKHLDEYDCRYIHLIRDCRGIVESNKKTSYSYRVPNSTEIRTRTRKALTPRQAIRRWSRTNLKTSALLNVFVSPRNRRIVLYEDLCNQPDLVLTGLCEWLGLGIEDVDKMIHFGSSEHHNISGNSARFTATRIDPADQNWKQVLSQAELKLINRHAGILNRWYGFCE